MPSAYFASTTVAQAIDSGGIGNDIDSAEWTNPANGSIKSDSQENSPSGYPGSPETSTNNWASADFSASTFSFTAKVLRVTGLVLASDGVTGIASHIPANATNIKFWPVLRFLDRNLSGSQLRYTPFFKLRNDSGGFGSLMQISITAIAASGANVQDYGIIDGLESDGRWCNLSLTGNTYAASPTYADIASAGFGYSLKLACEDLTSATQMGFNGMGAYASWDVPAGGGMRKRGSWRGRAR